MAGQSRYQYQEITGPVWRAPVAETLSWLPQGNPRPVRPQRRQYAALVCLDPYWVGGAAGGYDPAALDWLVQGPDAVARRRRLAYAALVCLDPYWTAAGAVAYNPAALDWLSQGPDAVARHRRRAYAALVCLDPYWANPAPPFDPQNFPWPQSLPEVVRHRRRAYSALVCLDPFWAAAGTPPTFDPGTFPWQEQARLPIRPERRITDYSVAAVGVYDPSELGWQPQGWGRVVPPERRRQSRSVISPFPVVVAPFDPQFFPWPMRLDRNLPVRALVTWTVLDPFPVAAVAYDPSAMAWLPVAMGRVLRPEPNRLDHTVGSAFPIVFDPATGFPWPPQIVPPRIARSSQGWTVLYPLGSGPVTIVPNLGQYTWQGFAPTIPELAVVAGGGRARAKIAYQQRDRRRIPEEQYFELTDDVVIVPGVGRIRWRGFAPALFITDVDEDHKIAMQMIDDPDIAQALLLAEQWLKGKKT